jgi:hypothetical protein
MSAIAEYQQCPVCTGSGLVSRPPGVPGDQQVWSGISTSYTCRVCDGKGIILSPESQRNAAAECERKDCLKAMATLSAAGISTPAETYDTNSSWAVSDLCRAVKELSTKVVATETVYPASEYHEDYGSVLWWNFPVCEPPHLGSPLDNDWPGDKWTHFSRLPIVWDGDGTPLRAMRARNLPLP